MINNPEVEKIKRAISQLQEISQITSLLKCFLLLNLDQKEADSIRKRIEGINPSCSVGEINTEKMLRGSQSAKDIYPYDEKRWQEIEKLFLAEKASRVRYLITKNLVKLHNILQRLKEEDLEKIERLTSEVASVTIITCTYLKASIRLEAGDFSTSLSRE